MEQLPQNIICRFFEISTNIENHEIFNSSNFCIDCVFRLIYKIFGKYIKTEKNTYNYIGKIFNKIYFHKNLLKSIIFFDKHHILIEDGIVDVGCGAAPASIAISKLIEYKQNKKISICLLDNSEYQLAVAKDFMKRLSINNVSFKKREFDFDDIDYNRTVIFSYFFCEQKKSFIKYLFNNRHKFSKGFVIIDYKENIKKIENYFKLKGDSSLKTVYLKYLIPESLHSYIKDMEVEVCVCFYKP